MAGVKTNFYVVGYNDNVTEGDCEAETEANKVKSILHYFTDEGQHSIASCIVLAIIPIVVLVLSIFHLNFTLSYLHIWNNFKWQDWNGISSIICYVSSDTVCEVWFGMWSLIWYVNSELVYKIFRCILSYNLLVIITFTYLYIPP